MDNVNQTQPEITAENISTLAMDSNQEYTDSDGEKRLAISELTVKTHVCQGCRDLSDAYKCSCEYKTIANIPAAIAAVKKLADEGNEDAMHLVSKWKL